MADHEVRLPDIWEEHPDRDRSDEAVLAGAWRLPALRWYQHTALARWNTAGRRGVIALPTGAGKTMVALAAIAELGVPALVLVPTRVLLEQWGEVLSRRWDGTVGKLGDGEYRIGPVTIATYASAAIWAPRIGDRFGLVIVDEAHHVGAWCPAEILEMLVAPARLGLTATPPDGGTAEALAARIGPVIYTLRAEALAGDALASYQVIGVPIALEHAERESYRTLRGRFAHVYAKHARLERGEMTWRKFMRLAASSTEGREALEAWKDYRALVAYPVGKQVALRELLARHAGERTLVFTADNATAYRIARELLVVPITHEIGRLERNQILARFRAGEISVLVSSQVLDEGFDVPDADIAIIVGGSSSARRQVQRIGRVLRPREGKQALIYELAVLETTEVEYVRRRRAGMELSAGLEANGASRSGSRSSSKQAVAWSSANRRRSRAATSCCFRTSRSRSTARAGSSR